MNSPPLSVSIPRIGKGKSVRARWRAARTASWLRCKRGRHSVHPVATSVSESRVQVAALDICATMGHQIRFQEARSGFIPLLKGANRDLLLEQRSRSSGGEARTIQFALRGQQAIRRCRAHGKQLFSALLREVEMLMPFQRLKERGEKGNEAFGTDAAGGVPDQEQRVLHV